MVDKDAELDGLRGEDVRLKQSVMDKDLEIVALREECVRLRQVEMVPLSVESAGDNGQAVEKHLKVLFFLSVLLRFIQ